MGRTSEKRIMDPHDREASKKGNWRRRNSRLSHQRQNRPYNIRFFEHASLVNVDIIHLFSLHWIMSNFLMLNSTKFIFRQPPLSMVSNLFILPFEKSVWLAITILLSIIFGLVLLSTNIEWKKYSYKQKMLEDDLETRKPNVSDNLLLIIGAVTQQGRIFGIILQN